VGENLENDVQPGLGTIRAIGSICDFWTKYNHNRQLENQKSKGEHEK
jgi:hypothetical protein